MRHVVSFCLVVDACAGSIEYRRALGNHARPCPVKHVSRIPQLSHVATDRRWLNASVRNLRRFIVPLTVAIAVVAVPAAVSAHDEALSSDPPSGAMLDEPISEVTIDFGESIGDDLEMALVYDLGNAEVEQIPATVTKVSDTVGKIEFDQITDKGRYFVRYLVTIPADGHVLAGAVSFDYGEAAGSGTNWYLWLVFGLVGAAVIATTGWYTLRPRPTADISD